MIILIKWIKNFKNIKDLLKIRIKTLNKLLNHFKIVMIKVLIIPILFLYYKAYKNLYKGNVIRFTIY